MGDSSVTRAALALALAGLLGGCLQAGTPGTVGTVADTADASEPVDTRPAVDTSVGAGDTTSRPCPPGGLTITTGALESPLTPWAARVTRPSTIAFGLAPWPEDREETVLTWRPLNDGAAEPVDLPAGAALIDGRDGALLVDYPIAGDRRRRLRYVDDTTNAELTEQDERVWTPSRHDPPHHLVTQGRAAFRSCVYDGQGACLKWRLRAWIFGGDQVQTLFASPDPSTVATAPFVTEDAILWAEPVQANDGPWRIRELRDGAMTTLHEVDGPVQEVVAHTRGVLWTTPEAVWYAKADEAPRQIHAGPCIEVDSDGTRAVMLCPEGDLPGPVAWYPQALVQPGDLWVFAGGQQMSRIATEGAVGYPRVDRGIVAWLAFPAVVNDCFDRGRAKVMVASTTMSPITPVEVAEIDTTCFCCAAIWPPHALSLGRGLLAWTYAPSDAENADPPWDTTRLGWAQVATCQ
ncbi:MAG: hypothetical protein EP329_10775 [Deltaproteobacteria bacterium]|nr:MAG: hypothetical protein EP329_10775 [Deltaproteobacteria bacterium]